MVSNLLMQAGNYVQSNNLAYRTVLDVTGYDAPVYLLNRNKEEAREIVLRLTLSGLLGFLFAPFYVVGFNALFAKKYLNGNKAFFRLAWNDLDPNNRGRAVEALEKVLERHKKRIASPTGFDQLRIIQHTLKKSLPALQEAVKALKKTTEEPHTMFNKIYKAKRAVVLSDLLLTSFLIVNIPLIRNWFTKVFSKKDRFTGTLTYLDDQNLQKLVGDKKKRETLHRAISTGLILLPPLVAAGVLKKVKSKQLNNLPLSPKLKKLRDGFDYHSGIFMTNGSMVAVFLATAFNYINVARDTYERIETILKYSLILPSFFYGDLFFNGNIARFADKSLKKTMGTPQGTLYHADKSGKVLVHSKSIHEVMESVEKIAGKEKAIRAGKLASQVFYAGLVTHSIAVGVAVYLANQMTRKRVAHDLDKIEAEKTP